MSLSSSAQVRNAKQTQNTVSCHLFLYAFTCMNISLSRTGHISFPNKNQTNKDMYFLSKNIFLLICLFWCEMWPGFKEIHPSYLFSKKNYNYNQCLMLVCCRHSQYVNVMLRWRYDTVNPDLLEQEEEVTAELGKVVWCKGIIYRWVLIHFMIIH